MPAPGWPTSWPPACGRRSPVPKGTSTRRRSWPSWRRPRPPAADGGRAVTGRAPNPPRDAPVPVDCRPVPVLDLRAPRVVELGDLRIAGGLMLAAGVVRGFLHHPPGIPCPLRLATGIPCPLCGMTTSVTATTHAHLVQAIAANPAGPVAVAAAVVLLVLRR